MSKKWRVLYAIQSVGVDLDAAAGPAVLIRQNVESLRQAGHQATILYLDGRTVKASDGKENSWLVPLGVSGSKLFKLIESGIRRVQSELQLPYFGIFESFRFYEAARSVLPNYDLCHEYHTLFGLGAALACQKSGIPRIMTIDADLLLERALIGQPLRGVQAAAARWAARFSFRTAAKLICVSEAARSHFVNKWGIEAEKIAVVANGVDPEKFYGRTEAEPARPQFEGKRVVIFVGGFQLWHGLELLVEAFARVLKRHPDAYLVLVGDGPSRSDVEQAIERLHLNDAVLITGYIEHEQVPHWLETADVAVAPYPSLPEELWFSPLKLYEYMAAGKAIVASEAGQIAEVIQDGHNGVLVKPGEVSQLAQAIIDLLDDPDGRQRLGENARQQAIGQHSWTAYTRRLESLYETV